MAATVAIAEENGAVLPTGRGTQTDSITNTNMGSTDAVNLDAATYPITAGQNSYEKIQHFRVSAAGGSSYIQNLKIWASAVLASGATLYTSATTTSTQYKNHGGYWQPVATASTAATWNMGQTTPSTANVGISGSILSSASLNLATVPASSDRFVTQIKTSSDATAGTTVTMNYQYDEVA